MRSPLPAPWWGPGADQELGHHRSSGARRLEEGHRLRDALELERSDLAQGEAIVVTGSHDRLTDVHAARCRMSGDPGGDVHGAAEVVTLVVEHGSGVDPGVGRR